jgi:type IV secretory pathway VirB2 component (pilin)
MGAAGGGIECEGGGHRQSLESNVTALIALPAAALATMVAHAGGQAAAPNAIGSWLQDIMERGATTPVYR